MSKTKLMLGDNIESLKKLPDNSVDSIVTDPPYGLSFMGKKWDHDVPSVDFWREVYRVLKPGGHVLSFGGTRTYHRMTVNIEDAGFEIRDQIMWLYGSGFPKSHNIGKAVDKLQGNEREVVGKLENYQDKRGLNGQTENVMENAKPRIDIDVTKGNSEYEGWGTALKPANEPICVARKPLSEKSVALNVLKWGTGGINIDGCRVGSEVRTTPVGSDDNRDDETLFGLNKTTHHERVETTEGRFPANIILECLCDEVIKGEKGERTTKETNINNKEANWFRNAGGDKEERWSFNDKGDIHTNPMCPCYIMDEQSGVSSSQKRTNFKKDNTIWQDNTGEIDTMSGGFSDKGGASRFFYQAKVSKAERNMGLDNFEDKKVAFRATKGGSSGESSKGMERFESIKKNNHPTVKPVNLMAYLCRLVTPPNGIVLDPYMGSGATGIAARLEGFRFLGMELDEDYFKIAEARINNYEKYSKFKK
jgi:site-specific DNA-methyltransferase (adenine-specific)